MTEYNFGCIEPEEKNPYGIYLKFDDTKSIAICSMKDGKECVEARFYHNGQIFMSRHVPGRVDDKIHINSDNKNRNFNKIRIDFI
jgi:hypothetical protein